MGVPPRGCSLISGALGQGPLHTARPESVRRPQPTQCQGQHGRVRSCWATPLPGRAAPKLLALPSVGRALGVGEAAPARGPGVGCSRAYLPAKGLRAREEAAYLASLLSSSERPSSTRPSGRWAAVTPQESA